MGGWTWKLRQSGDEDGSQDYRAPCPARTPTPAQPAKPLQLTLFFGLMRRKCSGRETSTTEQFFSRIGIVKNCCLEVSSSLFVDVVQSDTICAAENRCNEIIRETRALALQ